MGSSAPGAVNPADAPGVGTRIPVGPPTVSHPRNYTWSELMKRVWALDVLECPRCLSRRRILAAIHPPDTTQKILECLKARKRTSAQIAGAPVYPSFSF